MTRTTSPAPWGVPGLEFGNTTERPYSESRPHGGQDHQWRYADPVRSRQVVASVPGVVTAAYRDGGNHFGWGNYVDITVPTIDGSSVMARLAHHDTVSVRVGQRIDAGDPVGVMGDTGEAGGVHLHEELWINGRRVDPIYYRTHDIPGTPTTAGADARPFPNPQEDDIMLMLSVNSPAGPHLCSLSTGVFRHFIPTDPTDKIMRLARSQDDWQDVELSELPALLRTYGCDLAIWDLQGDKFVVLDPLDGSVKSGNMWSATNAVRAGVAQVKVTSEQTRAYLAKLNKP